MVREQKTLDAFLVSLHTCEELLEEEHHVGVPVVGDSGQPWLKTIASPDPQSS